MRYTQKQIEQFLVLEALLELVVLDRLISEALCEARAKQRIKEVDAACYRTLGAPLTAKEIQTVLLQDASIPACLATKMILDAESIATLGCYVVSKNSRSGLSGALVTVLDICGPNTIVLDVALLELGLPIAFGLSIYDLSRNSAR